MENRIQDCKSNLKICNAECCKEFTLTFPENTSQYKDKKILSIKMDINPSRAWYYRLHGADYTRGVLRVKLKDAEFKDNMIIFHARCKLLTEDNLCKTHPTKPEICKALDWNTANLPNQNFYITPNCIYKKKDI